MQKTGGKAVVLLVLSAWLFFGLLCGITQAASANFPKKPITIIVSFAAGGARDILARGVGKTMSKHLGVPIIIVNEPGAGGARGLISLFNAPPDGHTLGVGQVTDIIDQVIEKREYDNKKFTYIGRAQYSSGFLLVKGDSPFRSVKDFKSTGKVVRHSTFGLTIPSTVMSMIVADREGFPLAIVGGFKNSVEAMLSLTRDEVEFSGSVLSTAAPFIKAGQIRPILTMFDKRLPDFPNVPTMADAGYPDLDVLIGAFWFMAPPGVPKAQARILEDALMKTLKDPEFLAWAKGAGVDPGPLSAEETSKTVLRAFTLVDKYRALIESYIKK